MAVSIGFQLAIVAGIGKTRAEGMTNRETSCVSIRPLPDSGSSPPKRTSAADPWLRQRHNFV